MPLDSSAYPREMLRCQWLERTADVLKMLRSLRPPSMGSKILRPKPTCRGVGWRSDLTVTPRRTVGLQVWIFLALFVYVCVYLSLKYYHSKYAMCVNVACYLKQYQTDSGYTKVCFVFLVLKATKRNAKMVQNDSQINELMTFVFSFLKKSPLGENKRSSAGLAVVGRQTPSIWERARAGETGLHVSQPHIAHWPQIPRQWLPAVREGRRPVGCENY